MFSLQSIDFHERGKNHKENVAAKISEVLFSEGEVCENSRFNLILPACLSARPQIVHNLQSGLVWRDKVPDRTLLPPHWTLLPLSLSSPPPPPLQIKKKSVAKAKQEERMSKEFAAMEEAAMKAYQEDLKRLEREASGSLSLFRWTPLF